MLSSTTEYTQIEQVVQQNVYVKIYDNYAYS